jgi:hypothetical protein
MSRSRTLTDRLGEIAGKSNQLVALLNLCYGAGFESFASMTKELQDSTLWLAADLAQMINSIACGADHAKHKQPQLHAVDAPSDLELVEELDQTVGLLATASQSFCDISALFEAIKSAAPARSLQSRLAQTGINMAESLNCDFDRYSRDFVANVERFSTALGLDEFRRFSCASQSSSVRGSE